MVLKKIALLIIAGYLGAAQAENPIYLNQPKAVYLTGVNYTLELSGISETDSSAVVQLRHQGKNWFSKPLHECSFRDGHWQLDLVFPHAGDHSLSITGQPESIAVRVIPGWLSLLPPFAAILLALLTRQVLIALLAGVWLGATFLHGHNPFFGFLFALTEYVGKAAAEPDRIAILIFSLALGGMVGVISKSGGTQGIVQKLSAYARNARHGQIATWFMGIVIFFDDYANTLIVGNTMRPLTDKLKISREKLSYLVDSTAAPVANIAIISTWIGYELSLINDSLQSLDLAQNAYITFFKTIPLNFYPIFTLAFGFAVAYFGRDFFSMHKAELRAARGKGVLREGAVPLADLNSAELTADEGTPLCWFNALIPVLLVILTTLAGLWFTGKAASDLTATQIQTMGFVQYVSTVIGNSDSFSVLMWAAFIGGFSAIILALLQGILNLNKAIMAWVGGIKAMVMAALILVLAWSIGNICRDLQTAGFVIEISRDFLSPHWIPLLTFIISGVIAFSTGTSWGTMAILTPIVMPLAYQIPLLSPGISEGLANTIFLSSIAAILAGATFGDHCSPISDTTIMSSMASGADHIDHVRTQLPYALMVGTISMVLGYIPIGYGAPAWLMIPIGLAGIFLLVRFLGKSIEERS